jgi:hypothetical protein
MNQKPIFARLEFYNFLAHYFSIINRLLNFCSQNLSYASDLANAALFSIPISDGVDNLKSHREQISKMQKQIKDYKREVDDQLKRLGIDEIALVKGQKNYGSSVCVMQWTRFISDVTLI